MRRLSALVLLLALAGPAQAGVAPTPAPTAEPEPTQGVNVVPDTKSPHRSTSGTFLEFGTVTPARPVADAVLVKSTFDTERAVSVYPADATPAVGGGFGFGGRQDQTREVGAWLRLAATTVRVPPMGQVRVPLRLVVPAGTSGGEYVGGVIAESVDQGQATAVQTRTRFAMAVYLKVPGGASGATPGRGRPDGRFEVLEVEPRFDGGRACPRVRYRNDSQDIVDPEVTVRTRGLLGSGESYDRRRVGAVLPGAQATVPLACISRPIGPGSLDVTLRSPKGDGGEAIDFRWLPLPFLIALLFLLVLLGALLATFLRGLRRRRAEPEPAVQATAPANGPE